MNCRAHGHRSFFCISPRPIASWKAKSRLFRLLRASEFAAWQRDEHGRVLAVAAILLAELLNQIVLLQLDAEQDVTGYQSRKEQMTCGHCRRRPNGEQDAEIDRVPHTSVE